MSRKLKRNLLSLAITAVLATGCGGGGGGSDPQVDTSSSVTGGASKGIVSQGLVTAYVLNELGEKGDLVGSASTGADGSYSLKLGDVYDNQSPLLLELAANSETLMKCDALNGCGDVERGDAFTPSEGLLMSAIIQPVTEGKSVDAQITPFTDMAAAFIKENGEYSSDAIVKATVRVNEIVGIPVMDTQPVDITNPESLANATIAQQQYAVMLAALAEQIFSGATDTTGMVDALQDFSEDFADGTLGDELEGGLSPTALFDAAAAEVFSVPGAADQITGFINTVEVVDDKLVTAEPALDALDDISQVKALVADTRIWIDSFDSLDAPIDAFGDEIDTIDETLDQNAQAVLKIVGLAVSGASDAVDEALKTDSAIPTTVEIFNDQGESQGTVSVTDKSTTSTTAYRINVDNIPGVNAILDAEASTKLPAASLPAGGTVSLLLSGTASNAGTKIVLSNTEFSITLQEALDLTTEDSSDSATPVFALQAEVEPTNEEPVFSDMGFSGNISVENLRTGDKIAGGVEIALVRLTTASGSLADVADLSVKKIALNNISVSSASGSEATLRAVSLEIDNAETFDTIGFSEFFEGAESAENYIEGKINVTGNLQLAGFSDIDASITVNKTGYQAGNVLVNLAYNGRSVTLDYDVALETKEYDLTISNPNGPELIINVVGDETSGKVMFNDKQVGSVDGLGDTGIPLIRYVDGTVESL